MQRAKASMKTIAELKSNKEHKEIAIADNGVFSRHSVFAESMQMARALCSSTLVPQDYRGEQNLGNALIALEIAQRTGASPLMVMQNLYVVHGRPAWSAQFIIAALNSCGRFSPLRFEIDAQKGECNAWAFEKATGDRLDGPKASIAMSKAEGWYERKGSKWQTMPEVMLRYRAASFFGKLYAPDILMGMQSDEEIIDVIEGDTVEQAGQEQHEGILSKIADQKEWGTPDNASEQPATTDDEWPREFPDENGEVRWADSSGAFFDGDLHAWSAREQRPGVKSDGSFRARRGARRLGNQDNQDAEPIDEVAADFGNME